MNRIPRIAILTMGLTALFPCQLAAQEDSGWRISPENINIKVGDDRRLQLLDDLAQELHGAVWSVDDESLAEIREGDGRAVVHAKAVGTVRVSASMGPETRYRKIQIWPEFQPLPVGTTNWAGHPIGRDIGDLPAVPTGDGPTYFSVEQTASGSTYLEASEDDGIQVWTWLMPEQTRNVELICGDWLGGALIGANRGDSFELYTVGKDGKLRWQHNEPGSRKGLAISTEHMLYLLSQSSDGTAATFKSFDDATGEEKFAIPLPPSSERQVGVRKQGANFVCMPGSISTPSPIHTTRVHVNMDGYPYIALTQDTSTLEVSKCTLGSTVDRSQVVLSLDDELILWQIHADGTYRSTTVEAIKSEQPVSTPTSTISPTGAIMTDNMNGVLLPARVHHNAGMKGTGEVAEELVYRIDPEGNVVYKFPVPLSTGNITDEMVIASNDLGFATRGGVLIAFSVLTGKPLWRWDSGTPEITVFAALADGSCLVQTPTALVDVFNSTTAKEAAKGRFFMDWQGHLLRKHE